MLRMVEDAKCNLSVLLTFYKGQKFFAKQMESIVRQLAEGDEVIIRDDGSSSEFFLRRTICSLENGGYLLERGIIRIIADDVNVGVNESFLTLLMLAKNPKCVFCDQDDVWRPDRLESCRYNEASKLHIVNFDLGDCENAVLERREISLCRIFLKNKVPGCAMSGDRFWLIKCLTEIKPRLMYDQVVLVRALSEGVEVSFDSTSRFFYRRHDDTVTAYDRIAQDGLFKALHRRILLLAVIWRSLAGR